MLKKVLLILIVNIFLFNNVYAYESEDKLKVVVIGKVAKFVKWKRSREKEFVITILNNQYGSAFDEVYKNKKIHKKSIKIKYINSIKELTFTNILYIPKVDSKKLKTILKAVEDKNILVVSDIRGFAQKGGVIQIYFVSRKPKLKINLNQAKENNLKLSSSLLRISTVVKAK